MSSFLFRHPSSIAATLPRIVAITAALATPVGCGSNDDASGDPQRQALASVKSFISTNIIDLANASAALAKAAPAPDADGWNSRDELLAVNAMKTEWKRARVAYEHIEGAVAVLFPDLDYSTDQRYDAFLSDNGPDLNLFDDQNVTGIHAIERILWAPEIPPQVTNFEQALPGYQPAAFPSTAQQAADFKGKLCGRLVADVKMLQDQFGPLTLDSSAAFRGVIGSMGEQLEKAELAATGEEESRYASFTLTDMRTNVNAGVRTFAAFKTWLKAEMGETLIADIDAAFARVQAAYASLQGDALPPVPATWSSQDPTAADLQTPFGALWTVLHTEADPDTTGTLVHGMNRAADLLHIPQVP